MDVFAANAIYYCITSLLVLYDARIYEVPGRSRAASAWAARDQPRSPIICSAQYNLIILSKPRTRLAVPGPRLDSSLPCHTCRQRCCRRSRWAIKKFIFIMRASLVRSDINISEAGQRARERASNGCSLLFEKWFGRHKFCLFFFSSPSP